MWITFILATFDFAKKTTKGSHFNFEMKCYGARG